MCVEGEWTQSWNMQIYRNQTRADVFWLLMLELWSSNKQANINTFGLIVSSAFCVNNVWNQIENENARNQKVKENETSLLQSL